MPSHPRSAWERLGELLRRRRIEIDPRYRNRRIFVDERAPKLYRIINAIELGRRSNYDTTTFTALEVAYDLAPGAIGRALDGDDLEVQASAGLAAATAAAESPAVVTAPRPDQVPRKDVDFAAGIPPEELAPHVAAIEQAAYRALVDLAGAELPGPDDPDVRETMLSLPGKAVFPENEHDQRTWDNPVYSPDERVVFMARLRVLRARAVKEQRQRRTGTGLTGHIPASGAVPALISVGGKAYRASS